MPIVIELGRENKNVNPFIEPLGEARRGKWRRSNLPLMNLADAEVARLPDLPGYHISVDLRQRRIRVFDPLNDDHRREDIAVAFFRFFKRRLVVENELTTEAQTDPKLNQWLFAMKRLVQGGNAKLMDSSEEFPEWVGKQLTQERRKDAKRAGMRVEQEPRVEASAGQNDEPPTA